MADDTTATSRVVTIDLDDERQVEGLADALRVAGFNANTTSNYTSIGHVWRVENALRALLPKPKPEEPTGFGAVVRDVDEIFCRVVDVHVPWRNAQGDWHPWSHFSDAVEILFPGVAQ